jgi:hypothetical protein
MIENKNIENARGNKSKTTISFKRIIDGLKIN